MDKEIKIGPEEIFGESSEGMDPFRMMRKMFLSMEKDRIKGSGVPLNALGGTQSKVEFDDVRRVVVMTIELPFNNKQDWEDVKEVSQAYVGEPVLIIV